MLHLANKPVTSVFQKKGNSTGWEEEPSCVVHCLHFMTRHTIINPSVLEIVEILQRAISVPQLSTPIVKLLASLA